MTAMARRIARLLIALLLAGTLVPAGALAPAGALGDGDPASDFLLAQNVFYPFQPAVAISLQRALNAETAATQRAGLPLKVALIHSPADLGAIPSVFGKPQAYANFLDREISFNGPQPLLVVMPAGYGVQGLHAPASTALRNLRPPSGTSSDDLARAAMTAAAKLAAAAGHPVKVPSGDLGGGGSGSPTWVIAFAMGVAAVVLAGSLLVLRRRARSGARRAGGGSRRRGAATRGRR
jgi:hypothetical protein